MSSDVGDRCNIVESIPCRIVDVFWWIKQLNININNIQFIHTLSLIFIDCATNNLNNVAAMSCMTHVARQLFLVGIKLKRISSYSLFTRPIVPYLFSDSNVLSLILTMKEKTGASKFVIFH